MQAHCYLGSLQDSYKFVAQRFIRVTDLGLGTIPHRPIFMPGYERAIARLPELEREEMGGGMEAYFPCRMGKVLKSKVVILQYVAIVPPLHLQGTKLRINAQLGCWVFHRGEGCLLVPNPYASFLSRCWTPSDLKSAA